MDTKLSCHGERLTFELDRGEVPQRRVQPLPIVEDFDVLKHLPAYLLARGPKPMQAQLAFERAEETLLGSIIPTVALAGHAGDHPLLVQRGLVVLSLIHI